MSISLSIAEQAQLGVGIVSCLCLLLPILTYVLFEDLRCLKYIELVFYVSINDMVATIGATLGRVPNGSFACWWQGLVTNYHFLASSMWTAVIAYQLYVVTHHGLLLENMTSIHALCWLLPLVVTLLPLSTSTYGDADDVTSTWCVIRSATSYSKWEDKLWTLLGFYVWLWLAVLVMCYYLLRVQLRFARMGDNYTPKIASSLHKLSLYPLILLCCWLLPSIADMSLAFSPASFHRSIAMRTINVLSYISPLLQGILLSLVFCMRNPIVRDRWKVAIAATLLQICRHCGYEPDTHADGDDDGVGDAKNDVGGTKPGRSGSTRIVSGLGKWLSNRGGDAVTVHLRAENESDYSSRRSSVQSRAPSVAGVLTLAGKLRRSLGAVIWYGGDVESPPGSSVDPIPAAGAMSAGTALSVTSLGSSSSSPPFPLGASASPFGNYFDSGGHTSSLSDLSNRPSSGALKLSNLSSGATSDASTVNSDATTVRVWSSGPVRTSSGRPVGSPDSGNSNFSNSFSPRIDYSAGGLSPSPPNQGDAVAPSPSFKHGELQPASPTGRPLSAVLREEDIPHNPIYANAYAKKR